MIKYCLAVVMAIGTAHPNGRVAAFARVVLARRYVMQPGLAHQNLVMRVAIYTRSRESCPWFTSEAFTDFADMCIILAITGPVGKDLRPVYAAFPYRLDVVKVQ